MVNKGGLILYKCRMCGEEYGNVHAPDAFAALLAILNDWPNPWPGGMILSGMTDFHRHEGVNTTGVGDIIGVRTDEEDR